MKTQKITCPCVSNLIMKQSLCFMNQGREPRQLNVIESLYTLKSRMKTQLFLLQEHENQLVGHLIVNGGKVKRIKHVGYIVVGILKDYTGQGIGTALFNALENWRIGSGIKKKSLNIDGNYIDEYYMGKTFV